MYGILKKHRKMKTQVHTTRLKKYLKATVISLFLIMSLQNLLAQQDVQYTQYMYNTGTINPAYVGSQEALYATLMYRNQWAGLEGAPKVMNLTINSQLGRRTGGGLSFTSDNIGPSKESTLALDFSYTIPIGEYSQIAFGAKGGINLLNIDYSLLTMGDFGDPEFQQNIDNRLSPLVGLGAYFYNDSFYVGLSVPNILTTTYYDDVAQSNAQRRPNFYFIAGYVFNISEELLFKPAFLTKAVESAPLAFDLSANFLYNQQFTLGVAYRLNVAFSALAGFQVNENIQIGYAYDYNTTDLGAYVSGSHEVFLRFSLGERRDARLLEPRFF